MKLHRSSEFLNEVFEPKKVEGRDAIRKQKIEEDTKKFRPFLEKALEYLELDKLVSIDDYTNNDRDYNDSVDNLNRSWTLNTKNVGKSSLEQWYNITIKNYRIRSTKNIQYVVSVELIVGSVNHNTQTFELGKVHFYNNGDLAKINPF